jgi:hypothetical protein
MKYDKSKETIELLRKMKENHEAVDIICLGMSCCECPFYENDCGMLSFAKVYKKVCKRLKEIEMKKRTEFKVGDKATRLIHGVIKKGSFGLLLVAKDGCSYSYPHGIDGSSSRELFHGHIPIPESAYYAEEPEEVELSLQEIADKFGLRLEQLRIKE